MGVGFYGKNEMWRERPIVAKVFFISSLYIYFQSTNDEWTH